MKEYVMVYNSLSAAGSPVRQLCFLSADFLFDFFLVFRPRLTAALTYTRFDLNVCNPKSGNPVRQHLQFYRLEDLSKKRVGNSNFV
jgi:hypothetical protein